MSPRERGRQGAASEAASGKPEPAAAADGGSGGADGAPGTGRRRRRGGRSGAGGGAEQSAKEDQPAKGGEAAKAAQAADASEVSATGRRSRGRGGRGGRAKQSEAGGGKQSEAGGGKQSEAGGAKQSEAGGAKPARRAKKDEAAKGETAGAARSSTRITARGQRRTRTVGGRRRRTLSEREAKALRGGDKVMLVHDHEDRVQIGILEEGVLIEHYVQRKRSKGGSVAGNIYLGKVQNVLPGMEAAFVDIGEARNAVLYAGEVNYSPEDLEGDGTPRIEQALKAGQSVMVQVTKDALGTKGARLTSQLSLPGRFVVLAPDQDLMGISRRLAEKERARLRQILRALRPKGHGLIVRTAADGAAQDALERDVGNLTRAWDGIRTRAKRAKAPSVLYEEPDLVIRVLRELVAGDFKEVVVDTRAMQEHIHTYLEEYAPDLIERLTLHPGGLPVFEEYRVSEQIAKALEPKVWLPSGGSIVIERTEALTVIDVNTGKFVGKGKKSTLEDTVVANNIEAAEEIARQLRLRDIGGIIVIDFIDMLLPSNREQVLRTLKRTLARDRTRSHVFDVSSLGLVEMTRKKVSEGLLGAFSEPCLNCDGRGIVLTHEAD